MEKGRTRPMRRMKGDLKKLWSRLPLGQSRFWFDAAALAAALCMLGIAALHWAGDVVTDGARALGEPVAPSLLIDRQGKQLGVLTSPQYGYRGGELERQLPSLLKEAFVATEDKRFYSHGGVDFRALLRAAAANVSSGRIVEGGSSITQQLARTAYLSNEKSLLRKALEMAAALSLERRYSKEELLRQYLGRVYMGKQLYGVKAAAERYFGVSRLESLELWQIATLAAMPKGPALYNPIDYPERSKERRQVVLRLMREQGYITQRQMEAAGAVDYTAPAAPKKTASASLAEVVFREAEERASLTEEELLGGGYTVAIGLDAGLQAGLENLSSLDAGFPKSSFGRPVQAAAVVLDNGTAEIMAFAGERRDSGRLQPGFRPPPARLGIQADLRIRAGAGDGLVCAGFHAGGPQSPLRQLCAEKSGRGVQREHLDAAGRPEFGQCSRRMASSADRPECLGEFRVWTRNPAPEGRPASGDCAGRPVFRSHAGRDGPGLPGVRGWRKL